MNLQLKSAEVRLKHANLLTLDDSLDARIECLEGSLWITQDGDPRDVILGVGQSHHIDRTSRVMVFATSDARLQVSSWPAQVFAKPRNVSGWLARLSGASQPSVCANHCAASS